MALSVPQRASVLVYFATVRFGDEDFGQLARDALGEDGELIVEYLASEMGKDLDADEQGAIMLCIGLEAGRLLERSGGHEAVFTEEHLAELLQRLDGIREAVHRRLEGLD